MPSKTRWPERLYRSLAALLLAFTLSGCSLLLTGLVVGGAVVTGTVTVAVGTVAIGTAVVSSLDRRDWRTQIDDEKLTVALITALKNHKAIGKGQGNRVRPHVFNGVVLLIGEVTSEAVKRTAGRVALGVKGVRKVVNELVVGPIEGLTARGADGVLAARAKAALTGIDLEHFSPLRVKVIAWRGTLYLMGLATEEEQAAVVEKLRYLRGVKRIVKVFETIDHAPELEAPRHD